LAQVATRPTPLEATMRRRPLPAEPRLAGVVVEVADLTAARAFYDRLLDIPPLADGRVLAYERGGQRLELVERAHPRTLSHTGQHQAYCVPEPGLDRLVRELENLGCETARWREDRPEERSLNVYALDPSGNRVQLVPSSGGDRLLDHACIELHDLELAEQFYARTLGGAVEYLHGWAMEDYAEAHAWGDGKDPCAPWTRRWDVRYWDKMRIARPNMQTFVRFGGGVAGLILATEHRQEPPPEQQRGTPRLLLASDLPAGQVAAHLSSQDVPFEQDGRHIFLRDPGGNFVQVACA
jgi:catechol 2,3-dioxygenase-like lactoylglutathione lyase family enzyme